MDLYEAFRETGLPRDIIGIIDEYASYDRYPHKITIAVEIEGKAGLLCIEQPFKDNIITFRNARAKLRMA